MSKMTLPRRKAGITPRPGTPSKIPVLNDLLATPVRYKNNGASASGSASNPKNDRNGTTNSGINAPSPNLIAAPSTNSSSASSAVKSNSVTPAPVQPASRNTQLKKLEALVRATAISTPVSPKAGTSKSRGVRARPNLGTAGDLAEYGRKDSQQNGDPWVDKHQPQSLEQLFVHKKKVEEFESWLNNTRGSNICLLSGSAGSGRTATVNLVAKAFGYEVKEWINPMSLTEYNPDNWKGANDEVRGRSQMDQFTDFLLRSSQYPTLRIKGRAAQRKTLILVEDLPNTLHQDPAVLHQILRNYKTVGEQPLVFITTSVASSNSVLYKLFPQTLLTELDIQHITFNVVAASLMYKFLSHILNQESVVVDKSVVDEIMAASAGDVRWAVNNLQFRLQKPKEQPRSASGFKRPLKRAKPSHSLKDKTPSLGEREESLFLFRALGKVLYAKRDLTDVSEIECKFTGKLEAERRIHSLVEVPERIGDKIEVSPETFLNFLAQNYLSFFNSLDDVVKATGYLSDAAHMFSCWNLNDLNLSAMNYKNREAREEFGLSIGIRGLMHSNNARVSSTWKPLRKPGQTLLNTRVLSAKEGMVADLFEGPYNLDFFADYIPYFARILPRGSHRSQINYCKEVGMLKESQFARKGNDMIDDSCVDGGSDESINMPESEFKKKKKDKMASASPRKMEVDYVEADGEYAIEGYESS